MDHKPVTQKMKRAFNRQESVISKEDTHDSSLFRHAKLQKYINMMTIMTNCLTSKNFVRELLEPSQNRQLRDLSRTLAWFDENLPKKADAQLRFGTSLVLAHV